MIRVVPVLPRKRGAAPIPPNPTTPTADERRRGQVLRQGVMEMLSLPARQLTPLIRAVITPATLLVVLVCVDPRLAAIAAGCMAAMGAVYWLSGRVGRRTDEAVDAAISESSDRIVEFAHAQPVMWTTDRAGARRALNVMAGYRVQVSKEWLGTLGDPAVDAALASRSGQPQSAQSPQTSPQLAVVSPPPSPPRGLHDRCRGGRSRGGGWGRCRG